MATLKISDLSVGDWVEFKGELCKVLECGTIIISPRTIEFKPRLILSAKYDIYDCVDVDKVRPIPITAEILKKNGFARGKRGNFYHYLLLDKNRILYIHASTNGWRVQITYDAAGILRTTHLMPDMNSVHQLQHALRLAGIDKDINL